MKRHVRRLLGAMAGAALFALPAVAQQTGETLTVEIDVFSGRPNPKFTIDSADLPWVYSKVASLCGRSDAPAADYPEEFPGYRGVLISRAGADGGSALSAMLARKGARFLKNNPPAVCRDRARAAATDVTVSDEQSGLERYIIDLALQRGKVNAALHGMIMKAIEKGGS